MEILIGIISGMVTAIGMGGGTVLIILLTLVLGVEQHIAQATNLFFFIPTSITAILLNIKNKNIDLKIGIPILILGIIGAILGTMLSEKMEIYILKKLFGFFLIIVAIHEIYNFYKKYIKNKNTHNKI